MSDTLEQLEAILAGLPPGVAPAIALAIALVGVLILHRVAILVLDGVARRSGWLPDDAFHRLCYQPLRWVLVWVATRTWTETLQDAIPQAVEACVTVLLIVSVGWLASRLVAVLEESLIGRLRLDDPDNLRARRLYTQIRFLRRLFTVLIFILTFGAVLLSFDSLRQIGAGLLTSAGIAGIVIGFAAQRAVGNLIAGFQIAFTQPIRTEDVVIVEGEWGTIEEITLTYVVVRIWDERRLVVPISYFIEKPFQNWTRRSAELLGTVFLHVDYRVPLDDLREELQRIVQASSRWDGRVALIQVTDALPTTVQVRALVSAADAGKAWELRCEVREGLLRWLQENHPEALPRMRTEFGSAPAVS